jgi:hypothetical protein
LAKRDSLLNLPLSVWVLNFIHCGIKSYRQKSLGTPSFWFLFCFLVIFFSAGSRGGETQVSLPEALSLALILILVAIPVPNFTALAYAVDKYLLSGYFCCLVIFIFAVWNRLACIPSIRLKINHIV